ncbi:hypothetical protein [Marinobacter zhanjiangensis]|uniref:Uncharacterized protein n=1 Tax=Marinobacter zhanjiangensis TaxID=578215 RepID=A0ABQ3AWK1_9GAMM|nr:hypothetical protein [Marinobacter zhanjiangensis]GGY67469.1 hypothetical protein GCM10007071_13090 [Marinobacter zhanjiangensis]
MRRTLLVVAVLVVLVAVAVPGYRWMTTGQGSQGEDLAATAVCYPLRETCRWQTPAGEASVSMAALEGDELQMDLTLSGVSDPVIAILTGESMYMGEYPLRMEKTDDQDHFRARFVPPFCSTGDDMVWRVNLRVGTEALPLPVRLVFRHTGA